MEPNEPAPAEPPRPYRQAVRTGTRRAALHMVRAGYEMVAGVGAFLEELVRARSGGGGEGEPDRLTGPTRIPLD